MCDLFIYKMAAEHEEFIQTSDKEEENRNENVGLLGIFSHLQMGTNLLTNTQDTNPQDQLHEVVNEHNEVLHVFSLMSPSHPHVSVSQQDNSPQQYSPQQDNFPTYANYDYQPPGIPDEMFSNSESESTDTPHYIIDSSEEEEELVPKIRIPIKNYPNDTEHEEDFSNGWLWIEEDTGASYGPFTGNPGLNISPTEKDPRNYFELFFDPSMYTRIASETNTYARQRIRNITGPLPDFYSIFTRLLLDSLHSKSFLCNLYFLKKNTYARQRIRNITGPLPDFYSIFTRLLLDSLHSKSFLCNLYFFKTFFIYSILFHSFYFCN